MTGVDTARQPELKRVSNKMRAEAPRSFKIVPAPEIRQLSGFVQEKLQRLVDLVDILPR
jgi:hypothetical protein